MDASPLRLTPEMTSRELQALDFIKRYYIRHGHSPTLFEISSGLGVSRERARVIVRQLVRKEHVRRVRGQRRGIMLMNAAAQVSENDALIRLIDVGWQILVGGKKLEHPLTTMPLMPAPILDHNRDVETGMGGNGGIRRRRRGDHAARDDRAGEPGGTG